VLVNRLVVNEDVISQRLRYHQLLQVLAHLLVDHRIQDLHVSLPARLILQTPPLGEGGDVVLPDGGVDSVVVAHVLHAPVECGVHCVLRIIIRRVGVCVILLVDIGTGLEVLRV